MTRHLGKYEIVKEIGRGGFATVYRARDPDLDREVAIKVLDPTLMRDPSLVERFRREARAAARLRHPNIVRIHEISDAEGMLAIVMELLPGPSLREVIEAETPLPVERAVELLRPLAHALDYAHAQGLVHRDLKPSNALLDEHGQPVLTDFGLVKAAEESGSSVVSLTLSQTGMTLGTPAYMAPEQADPDAGGKVDHRADLYSLGVIAYEMLAGAVPFQGNTPLAVAMGHVMKPPPYPRTLNPSLPEGVEAALLKALEKGPEARFQTAAALVKALEAGVAPAVQPGVEPSGGPVRMQAAAPERTPADKPAFRKVPIPAAEQAPAFERASVAPARAEARREPARRAWLVPVLLGAAVLMGIVLAGLWATGILVVGWPTPMPTEAPASASLGDTATRPKDGMVMLYVPAGEFEMGSDARSNEQPVHTVYLDAYLIDRTEVTNAQFRKCVEAGDCDAPTSCVSGEPTYNDAGKSAHPVVCIPWYEAAAYCEWAGGRLPTEAEWECAARGSGELVYPWGDTFDGRRLNYCDANCVVDESEKLEDWKDTAVDDGYARTAPVGSYPAGASPYGALDMAGNVWEWVSDWYDAGYYGDSPGENPQGPVSGEYRVVRGGSWYSDRSLPRGASRGFTRPDVASISVGFRCVMSFP